MNKSRIFLCIILSISGLLYLRSAPGRLINDKPAASSTPGDFIAYVPVFNQNYIQPFDTVTDTLLPTINMGHGQRAVALSPDDNTLYWTNQAGSMGYLNFVTNASNQNVGFGGGSDPNAIAVTPNGLTAYVADEGGSKVVPFNAITDSTGSTIGMPSGPNDLAVTPDGTKLFVTVPGSNVVEVVSTSTNATIATVSISDPYAIAITPNGTTAWVTSYSNGVIYPIDTATLFVGKAITVGSEPDAIAISPDGAQMLVANYGSNSVTPINLKTMTPSTALSVDQGPTSIAITPDGADAFVTDASSGTVNPIALGATDSVKPSFSVGGTAYDIAISPDQAPVAQLSVTPGAAGSPSTFDSSASTVKFGTIVKYAWSFGDGATAVTETPTITHTYLSPGTYLASVTETDSAGTSTTQVFTGHVMSRNGSPIAQAFSDVQIPGAVASKWQALVANQSAGDITPVDLSTDSAGSPVTVGTNPTQVVINPQATLAIATNSGSNSISVITLSTMAVTNVSLSASPVAVAFNPSGSVAYIVTSNGLLIPYQVASGIIGTPVTVGGAPDSIAITPNGQYAFVAESGGGVIEVNLSSQTVLGSINVGGTPEAVAINPSGTTLFVVENSANAVGEVDIANATVTNTILVGTAPTAIAITPDGSTAFVTNSGSSNVTPIDLITNKAESNISLSSSPLAAAVVPNGTEVVVTMSSGQSVPITIATDSVGSAFSVGNSPVSITVTPDQGPIAQLSVTPGTPGTATSFSAAGSTIAYGAISTYFWNFGDGTTQITATDTTTHVYNSPGTFMASVTEVSTGSASTFEVFTGQTAILNGGPQATAYQQVSFGITPMAFVADSGTSAVSPIDLSTDTAGTNISMPSGSVPTAIAMSPNNMDVWVVNQTSNDLTEINALNQSVINNVSLGSVSSPDSLAITPDGNTIYIGVQNPDEVLVYNVSNNSFSTPIVVSAPVSYLALDPVLNELFILLSSTSTIDVYNLISNTVTSNLTTGKTPVEIKFSPDFNYAVVTNSGDNTIQIIDPAKTSIGSAITVGTQPNGVSLSDTDAYVDNLGSSNISDVDLASGAVSNTISLASGTSPIASALSPDGSTLWIVNGSSTPGVIPLTISTLKAGTQIALPTGSSPVDIALSGQIQSDWTAYVSDSTNAEVTPINTATNTASTPFKTVTDPVSLDITPDASKLLVASGTNPSVQIFATATNTSLATVNLPGSCSQMAITPAGYLAMCVIPSKSEIVPISLVSDSAGTPVTFTTAPSSVAITPDGNYALVTSGSNLIEIALASMTTVASISVGSTLTFVAVNPNEPYAYVLSPTTSQLIPINLDTLQVENSSAVSVGNLASYISVNPSGSAGYVVNSGSSTLTEVNLQSLSPSGTINLTTGSAPVAMAITPDGSTGYVAETGTNSLQPVNLANSKGMSGISVAASPTSVAIDPDQAPVAAMTNTGFTLGSPVEFSAAASTVEFGSITTYIWNFGDGTTATSSSPIISHTYTVSGSYTVTLTEIDSAGTSNQQSFTGQITSQNGGPSATTSLTLTVSASYHPISPVRVADTRSGSNEPYSGQTLKPQSSLNVQITNANNDNIPTDATAVVVNVTAVNPTQTSYLTVWPTGTSPPLASNLNFNAGQIVPNLVEIELGTNGQISIYNFAGDVDVLVDVEGYVGPSNLPGQGLFNSVSPYRVCDTRSTSPANQCTNKTLGSNQFFNVTVTGWPNSSSPPSTGTVPSEPGVSGVILNVTVTNTSAWSYLTIWPKGASQPLASNLNWTQGGTTVANRVIVPVSSTGQISIYNYQGSADVIVDVSGWYTDASNPNATGTGFSGMQPFRVCDTRQASAANQCNGYGTKSGTLSSGTIVPVQVAGLGGIPSMNSSNPPVAVVLNVTATNTTANGGYFTVYPDQGSGTQPPLSSDVNWSAGQTVANLVIVKLGTNGIVDVYNFTGSADLIIDAVGWYS
jgi:YVTN family beta-propeller protein